jgi:hypothetical protein
LSTISCYQRRKTCKDSLANITPFYVLFFTSKTFLLKGISSKNIKHPYTISLLYRQKFSRRIRHQMRNGFRPWIRDLGGVDWWKKSRVENLVQLSLWTSKIKGDHIPKNWGQHFIFRFLCLFLIKRFNLMFHKTSFHILIENFSQLSFLFRFYCLLNLAGRRPLIFWLNW